MPKPLPVVSQMPWHIQQNIIEAVDLETQFSIRQCSKQLKRAVDNSRISMDSLSFRFIWGSTFFNITVGHRQSVHGYLHSVTFRPHPDGFLREVQVESGQNIQKFVENGDYVDAAIEQFVKVLRTFPKLSMRQIMFTFRRVGTDVEVFDMHRRIVEEKLNRALSSLNRRLLVQNLVTSSNDNADGVCQILSHFRPGTLRNIIFMPHVSYLYETVRPLNLSEVVELEQWKQASSVHLYKFDIMIPLEKTAHFSKFCYNPSTVKLEEFKYIIDNMFCKNWQISRKLNTEGINYDTIVRYFSLRFESIRVIDAQTFVVCRGDFACEVVIDRQSISFSKTRTEIIQVAAE